VALPSGTLLHANSLELDILLHHHEFDESEAFKFQQRWHIWPSEGRPMDVQGVKACK
jgi:hypothetical protein